ncbi:redoxin domain-containing protein [Cytophagaceae bacterium ABcell3]|nr:redoxin domain-containing protein [Cytophagaceae bacterium ABcell3]
MELLPLRRYILITFLFVFAGISSTSASENNITDNPEIKVGDPAPDFTLKDPKGNEISLSQLRGKVVLLDFWASWCMPCRMANPEVVELYESYKSLGFDIFSVSLDAQKEAWEKAIKNDGLSWPNHGSELSGWGSQACELYGVEAIPSMFLIDENGIIIGKNLDERQLAKQLNQLFNKQVNFYPHTASSKLFFTDQAKFKIMDQDGNLLLKGKDEEVDITELPDGEYTIVYDRKKEASFKKQTLQEPTASFYPTSVTDSISFSRNATYEIYSLRGKLINQGVSEAINLQELPQGAYYLNIEGEVHKFFKK